MEQYLTIEVTRVGWIVFGVVLLVAEFFVPGAVIMFFGVGAILTGLAVSFGIIEGLGAQMIFWTVSSLVLVLVLRRQVTRWFPALETYNLPDENEDIQGMLVDVIKDVHPDHQKGRVRYQGVPWKAQSRDSVIRAGEKAKISGRDNLLVYVESVQGTSQNETN